MFGEKLKEQRMKKNMIQEEFADLLGINRKTYSNYEKNHRVPSHALLLSFAQKLQLPIGYFYGEKPLEPQDLLAIIRNPDDIIVFNKNVVQSKELLKILVDALADE